MSKEGWKMLFSNANLSANEKKKLKRVKSSLKSWGISSISSSDFCSYISGYSNDFMIAVYEVANINNPNSFIENCISDDISAEHLDALVEKLKKDKSTPLRIHLGKFEFGSRREIDLPFINILDS